jgi:hypothetical protein
VVAGGVAAGGAVAAGGGEVLGDVLVCATAIGDAATVHATAVANTPNLIGLILFSF